MKALRKIAVLFGLLFVPLAGYAQVTSTPANPPSNSLSLASALATAKIPSHRVYLTVAAETVPLPQESVVPPEKSSLTTVTDAYQRSVRAFGAVTAIAPPTMFVLNTHPANADLYAGLQPEQAFKMLAASLSDSQWHSLIGEDGLGLSDLNSDDQRALFQTIFPNGSLTTWVSQSTADGVQSTDFAQVRLRLTQNIQVEIPMKGEPNNYQEFTSSRENPSGWVQSDSASDNLFGVPQSALLPNRLKPGQLDWNLPALRVSVPLSGVKTVGDLVARISRMTGLELYADKRYESRSLTILGSDNGSAAASDLLRAVAYCVTGAFRQVGPAYVLTDDVVGVDARREILHQFETASFLRLIQLMNAAADSLGTKRSFSELKGLDDPFALTSDEDKNLHMYTSSTAHVELPIDQLTPVQQEDARQQAANATNDPNSAQNSFHKPGDVPDLSGKIQLYIGPQLELLAPTLKSPVNAGFYFPFLFDVSDKLSAERYDKSPHPVYQEPKPVVTPLAQTMALVQHRAVFLQPTSPAELVSDIAVMKHLGFNELWLDVFSQGHIQTALPDGSNLLTLALRKTRGTGIHVYAVIDLLQWGADAPPDTVDLDILGENSAQEESRLQQEEAKKASVSNDFSSLFGPITGLSVTPVNANVAGQLISMIRNLALRPGLAGIVWRNTAPSGYDHADLADQFGDSDDRTRRLDLGYTVAARLAFLRWQHADPIDISVPTVSSGEMDIDTVPITRIPNFNSEQQDAQLGQAWNDFRRAADVKFLQTLFTAAKESNPHLSLLVQGRMYHNWYGSWTSRTVPLPGWHTARTEFDPNEDRVAKTQSKTALAVLPTDFAKDTAELPSGLEAFIHAAHWVDSHGYHRSDRYFERATLWDGFVWDVTQLPKSAFTLPEPDSKAN